MSIGRPQMEDEIVARVIIISVHAERYISELIDKLARRRFSQYF